MFRADFLQILCKFLIPCARCIGALVVALLLPLLPVEGHANPLSPPPAGSWAAFPNSTLRPAMGSPPWNPLFIFDYSGGWFDDDRLELGVWAAATPTIRGTRSARSRSLQASGRVGRGARMRRTPRRRPPRTGIRPRDTPTSASRE
jgi:hypothetical protein